MTDRNRDRRAGGPADRARALGDELVLVHQSLRTDLRRIRRQLDSPGDGVDARPTELRAYCAAFCLALTRHHTSEDEKGFPFLRQRYGELAPVLAELERDHRLVADIVREVRRLLEELTPANVERVKRELDGLAAILESHFQWEERRLVQALNELDDPSRTAEELFGLDAPR